jgi:hypothetical protein
MIEAASSCERCGAVVVLVAEAARIGLRTAAQRTSVPVDAAAEAAALIVGGGVELAGLSVGAVAGFVGARAGGGVDVWFDSTSDRTFTG